YINRTVFESYEDFSANSSILIPDNFNYGYDVIDEYARLEPNKRALVWCNDKGEEKILTFKDISVLSDKAANLLKSHGAKRGDMLMTMLNRRYEFWILSIACHKLGVVIIPATYMLTPKDIVYRANSAKINFLVSIGENEVLKNIIDAQKDMDSDIKYFAVGKHEGFIDICSAIESAPTYLERTPTVLEDESLVYFTSGTTGYPKMVAHNFLYPLGHIYTAKFWQQVVDDGLHFTVAESGWAKCSWGKIYGQWLAGSAIFVYDYFGKFTPTDLLVHIPKYNITTFCAPPTIYRFLIKEDLTKYDMRSLSHCSTAGEPLNPEVWKQFKDATGHGIHEGFGQTESCIILGTFRHVETRLGSMGKPCPLYDIHLYDENYNNVLDGEVGEIVIKIRHNQCGLLYKYHNDPERTENLLGNGYHHTGDLAYRDSDGYFWFVGRRDDIIKSSGYRIGPFEVESALHEHPAVLECAITGVPDAVRGQIVKATIVLAKGYEPSPELVKTLQTHVKNATAPYKYPRIIEFVKELPKTISGKIRRNVIRGENKN
ncbi:MAG: acetyl-CoA synthetase, partial [Clostridia bacterium]|nr:acetyl-CoA synthetase [Clostridia bacterium]